MKYSLLVLFALVLIINRGNDDDRVHNTNTKNTQIIHFFQYSLRSFNTLVKLTLKDLKNDSVINMHTKTIHRMDLIYNILSFHMACIFMISFLETGFIVIGNFSNQRNALLHECNMMCGTETELIYP